MEYEKCLLNELLDIDWKHVKESEIDGNQDVIYDSMISQYGHEETIIKDIRENPEIPVKYKDLVIEYALKERLIFYEKTLEYLYKLSLMNVGQYIEMAEISEIE